MVCEVPAIYAPNYRVAWIRTRNLSLHMRSNRPLRRVTAEHPKTENVSALPLSYHPEWHGTAGNGYFFNEVAVTFAVHRKSQEELTNTVLFK